MQLPFNSIQDQQVTDIIPESDIFESFQFYPRSTLLQYGPNQDYEYHPFNSIQDQPLVTINLLQKFLEAFNSIQDQRKSLSTTLT